jgi:uncharacterized RDD family membrane protein YckC
MTAALLVDCALVFLATPAVLFAVATRVTGGFAALMIAAALAVLAFIAYWPLTMLRRGRTVGMWLLDVPAVRRVPAR